MYTFVSHLNAFFDTIKFAMEIEVDGKLLFGDIFIMRRSNGTLGRIVFREVTYTNLYLSILSYHHPGQKLSVMATLVNRARKIADVEHL